MTEIKLVFVMGRTCREHLILLILTDKFCVSQPCLKTTVPAFWPVYCSSKTFVKLGSWQMCYFYFFIQMSHSEWMGLLIYLPVAVGLQYRLTCVGSSTTVTYSTMFPPPSDTTTEVITHSYQNKKHSKSGWRRYANATRLEDLQFKRDDVISLKYSQNFSLVTSIFKSWANT